MRNSVDGIILCVYPSITYININRILLSKNFIQRQILMCFLHKNGQKIEHLNLSFHNFFQFLKLKDVKKKFINEYTKLKKVCLFFIKIT